MTFGVLIFPDVEELDFVGPWETTDRLLKTGPLIECEVVWAY